ncbi:MAG: hypothetical protein WCS31_06330 [Verrucomicrobiae bacterium]
MKPNILKFPKRCAVHSPTYSGVRVTAEMESYVKTLWDMPGPLVVVEDQGDFQGITWEPWTPRIGETKADIQLHADGWEIGVPPGATARFYPKASTLETAVAFYRSDHPAQPVPGQATLDRIKRCVFLDLWLIDGRIAHDYADVCRLLFELDALGIAEGTLLYLPGWHAPYDTRMPAWEPADALGGREGFGRMVALSKSLGAVVMPHFNFQGYDAASGLLENWEEDWTGAGWGARGGICPMYPIEYMQIDRPRWIQLFDSYFDRTVGEFELEAAFLDQCGNPAGESPWGRAVGKAKFENGDLVAATAGLLNRIHGKFPDLLLGAETLGEQIVAHMPLVQSSWLTEQNLGKFSPIARLMFEGRVRFFPHLFLAAATPCLYVYTNMPLIVEHGPEQVFQWYQENNRQLGAIPSVRLDFKRRGIDPLSLAVLTAP